MAKVSTKLPKTTARKRKRRGRGGGSGKGFHTTGSGMKGQKSRAGAKKRLWFEGGQVPLIRRLPQKKGFKPVNKSKVVAINLNKLNKLRVKKITEKVLRDKLGVSKKYGLKILGSGKVTKKFEVSGVPTSQSAEKAIKKAGGTIHSKKKK